MRVLALLLLAASTLYAQSDTASGPLHQRGRLWAGFAGGRGSLVLGCGANCGAPDPMPTAWRGGAATGFALNAGRTFTPDLLLGAEIGVTAEGGHDAVDENGAALMWASIVAHYHPRQRSALFLRGGFGAGTLELDAERFDLVSGMQTVNTTGPLLQGGLGYDIRLPKRMALTPMAQYLVVLAKGGHVTHGGRSFRGPDRPAVFLASLSLNWY